MSTPSMDQIDAMIRISTTQMIGSMYGEDTDFVCSYLPCSILSEAKERSELLASVRTAGEVLVDETRQRTPEVRLGILRSLHFELDQRPDVPCFRVFFRLVDEPDVDAKGRRAVDVKTSLL